jgi:hypothetical protein
MTPTPTLPPPFWVEAPIPGDESPIRAHVPITGVTVLAEEVHLLAPKGTGGARRVGIQVGHWKVDEAPVEFPNLRYQGGASIAGIDEVVVNLDVAERVAEILRSRGVIVDILPATIPPGYLADAFVSLHADDDGHGSATGFRIAHGFYRGGFEDALVDALTSEYAQSSGLPWNSTITDSMTDYYALAWFRYQHALAPHTPAAIVEMGFLSNARDRRLITERPQVIATGLANGILRFLEAHPAASLFESIVVKTTPPP